jgi:hypothetical protein
MKNNTLYLVIITVFLAVYYLFTGIYLNKLGYFNHEALFYIEKANIVFGGTGNRLKVMGLTAPMLPFFGTFAFTSFNPILAPVIASSIGTAVLFSMMASSLLRRNKEPFYLIILLVMFLLHPGILYAACSGKSTYLVLIFFYLFFLNIFKFYNSNTTFHISIGSICLMVLVFCDYKFIWLTLFFIPLVLSISLHSLNLSEQESIFRLFTSFNNPSLRRKLINKTFSIYIIIFLLPVTSVLIYKLLNLTHANDLNYFIESPYATWGVLADKIEYSLLAQGDNNRVAEVSVLISARIAIFCPMIFLAVYLFRKDTYQVLTLLTPFAFVEFLRIKYDRTYLVNEYYMLFVILSMLCVMIRLNTVNNKKALKIALGIIVLIQVYTGYYFLAKSPIKEEQNFMSALIKRSVFVKEDESIDMASYISSLPDDAQVLVDDAIAYPLVAFINNVHKLTMPYQDSFLSAIESPAKYNSYILIASTKNISSGYTQLTPKYLQTLQNADSNFNIQKVYETDNWILYRIL